ncbi:IS982 family transposase, partial [Streptomyces roseus]
MTTNLETLATALYVRIDDSLAGTRRAGRPPRLTDAELLTLAVMQAVLGFVSE